MKWLNKGAQALGIIMIAAGSVMCVLHFLYSYIEFPLLPAGITIFISGIIVFAANRFVGNIMEGFPNPPTMKDGINRISAAADMMRQLNKMNRLSSEGKPAKVKVLGFQDTGQLINYDPVIEFQLEVLMEHRYYNYRINSHKQIVSKILMGRIETGKEYFAKIDPEDKENILITFS